MVTMSVSPDPAPLPDNAAALKAMVTALQAENARMSATLRAHDQLIQTLRLRIAGLKKKVFGKSSEKIEREIEQLELVLEDMLIAAAESAAEPMDEDAPDPPAAAPSAPEAAPEREATAPPACLGGHSARAPRIRPRRLLPRLRGRAAPCRRGRQRDPRHGRGATEGPPDRPDEEVLPPLREDGAGTRPQQAHPRQHGERGATGLYPGLEIR